MYGRDGEGYSMPLEKIYLSALPAWIPWIYCCETSSLIGCNIDPTETCPCGWGCQILLRIWQAQRLEYTFFRRSISIIFKKILVIPVSPWWPLKEITSQLSLVWTLRQPRWSLDIMYHTSYSGSPYFSIMGKPCKLFKITIRSRIRSISES